MNPDDLIHIARHLASGGAGASSGRPSQADLRRAVSTVNIRIIYEGDLERLDAARTLPLADHIHPRLREMNLPHYLVTLFVEKSEWEQTNREYAALSEASPIP